VKEGQVVAFGDFGIGQERPDRVPYKRAAGPRRAELDDRREEMFPNDTERLDEECLTLLARNCKSRLAEVAASTGSNRS
jgi:hypothetical protein